MIRLKLGGYVDENNKVMTQQELDEWIVKIQAENARLREVLESISKNSCCHNCREAGLVAREALKGGK
jgi:hypothetical protein